MNPFAHVIHILLTILFFPWALVYICCLVSAGNSRKKIDRKMREEELQLLREIARKSGK